MGLGEPTNLHRAGNAGCAVARRMAGRPGLVTSASGDAGAMSRAVEESNRRMLRARDAMDRDYARPLDIPALARIAYVSEAHFIRTFRATFGETPHRYLQRRRVERAMFLLRETERSVSEICLDVGFASLGTFTRTFRAIVGEPPTTYRWRARDLRAVPACFARAWTRPSSFGEADDAASG
jgi:AraC-like DNA-binding protein